MNTIDPLDQILVIEDMIIYISNIVQQLIKGRNRDHIDNLIVLLNEKKELLYNKWLSEQNKDFNELVKQVASVYTNIQSIVGFYVYDNGKIVAYLDDKTYKSLYNRYIGEYYKMPLVYINTGFIETTFIMPIDEKQTNPIMCKINLITKKIICNKKIYELKEETDKGTWDTFIQWHALPRKEDNKQQQLDMKKNNNYVYGFQYCLDFDIELSETWFSNEYITCILVRDTKYDDNPKTIDEYINLALLQNKIAITIDYFNTNLNKHYMFTIDLLNDTVTNINNNKIHTLIYKLNESVD